jgi:hypothetical protein
MSQEQSERRAHFDAVLAKLREERGALTTGEVARALLRAGATFDD